MLFTLFHGQAFIERGFSVNKEVIGTNMLERTIVAHRTVCDAVAKMLEGQSDPKAVEKIEITKGMLKYCRGARARYEKYLDEARNKTKDEDEKANKKILENELNRERNKVATLEKNVKKLLVEADDLAKKSRRRKQNEIFERIKCN